MRSAVPLGALGTGSFEMRADGKLNFVIVLCFSFFIFSGVNPSRPEHF